LDIVKPTFIKPNNGITMKMKYFTLGIATILCRTGYLAAHCQMPCGIYHDEMVFNQVDQYIETMYKGITELNTIKFSNPKERNNFTRWVLLKETASDEMANLITQYFLQQKIKPDEPDTAKRLVSAHKMLFELTAIKQNVDLKMIETFADEWENFKQMFHVMNYECQIDIINRRKRQRDFELKNPGEKFEEKDKTNGDDHDHDHDHSHGDHDHTH
jgi:nickel superoxide dismutase